MDSLVATFVVGAEAVSDKKDLYPKLSELILGAIAFAILFVFMAKWVLPRINQTLEARRDKIQGDLEKAEQTRQEAEKELNDYRQQLSGAREEANRVIEEARQTAESMRKDLTAKAQQEYEQIVARAQEEIRAERDRVFQELKGQVGELSLALVGRVIGDSMDQKRQRKLVDQYIEELAAMPAAGNGHGSGSGSATGSGSGEAEA
jgi:F-type H+-transporting ATPase subunit b